MTKVSTSTNLPVTAEKVWELIGGFNALPDWHPAVEKSELEDGGQQRRLSLMGGGTIVERLEPAGDGQYTYSYSIVDSLLPVANYVASIKVIDDGDGCRIDWSSEFEAAGAPENEAMDAIAGIYQAGFDNLKKIFGG